MSVQTLDATSATESSVDRFRHIKFAVIPTNGRECLDDCINAIQSQVDKVILVNTTEDQLPYPIRSPQLDQIYAYPGVDGVNISGWWNMGLRHAENWAHVVRKQAKLDQVTWDVAILNDDAIVPEGWLEAVSSNMRAHGAVAGCSGNHDVILRKAEAVFLDMRMQGFAFVLAGEHGLRANELFTWYYSDDYIDWESRVAGGMAMVRGFAVDHRFPNGQMTPEIQVQVAQDAANFHANYGRMPW